MARSLGQAICGLLRQSAAATELLAFLIVKHFSTPEYSKKPRTANRPNRLTVKSGVAASLCHRSPKRGKRSQGEGTGMSPLLWPSAWLGLGVVAGDLEVLAILDNTGCRDGVFAVGVGL